MVSEISPGQDFIGQGHYGKDAWMYSLDYFQKLFLTLCAFKTVFRLFLHCLIVNCKGVTGYQYYYSNLFESSLVEFRYMIISPEDIFLSH